MCIFKPRNIKTKCANIFFLIAGLHYGPLLCYTSKKRKKAYATGPFRVCAVSLQYILQLSYSLSFCSRIVAKPEETALREYHRWIWFKLNVTPKHSLAVSNFSGCSYEIPNLENSRKGRKPTGTTVLLLKNVKNGVLYRIWDLLRHIFCMPPMQINLLFFHTDIKMFF